MSSVPLWEEEYSHANPEFPVLKATAELWIQTGKHQNKKGVTPKRKAADEDVAKEKSPWRAITNRSAGNQSSTIPQECWKQVQLRLDQSEGSLKIWGDVNHLHYKISLIHLKSTDIRRVDRSLVAGKKRTIALFVDKACTHNFISTNNSGGVIQGHRGEKQPVYLSFPSNELLHSWLMLLRLLSKTQELPFRISRTVHLDLVQAMLFGISKGQMASDQDDPAEELTSHAKLFCEILINTEFAGVTASQTCHHRTFSWHHSFTFPDLPELSSLQINLRRDKKGDESALLGTCYLNVQDWRRGVQHSGHLAICEQRSTIDGHRTAVGEIKYKMKIEEVVILPGESYKGFETVLHAGGVFNILHDAEVAFRIQDRTTDLFDPMVSICIAQGTLEEEVRKQAEIEVDDPNATHNALFRGTSILSRVVGLAMKQYGQDWLESTIGGHIRDMCGAQVAIQLDQSTLVKGAKGADQSKTLVDWCDRFWGAIWQAREECPSQLRSIFHHIKTQVEKRFGPARPNLHWQVVAAFVFLRFFVAAIIDPQIWGLWPSPPPPSVQQSLKSVGKVIQTLANMNQDIRKDNHEKPLANFLEDNVSAMRDYLNIVSTPKNEDLTMTRSPKSTNESWLRLMRSIRLQQQARTAMLEVESVGCLPYFIDIPQKLAIVASLLVEHCKKLDPETFDKRGVALTPQSLQKLANLAWQALAIRQQTLNQVKNNVVPFTTGSHGAEQMDFEIEPII